MGQEISSRRLGVSGGGEGAELAQAEDTEVGECELSSAGTLPRFSRTIWLASCRPAGRLSRFARPLLYQPDTRLFCPHGPSCRQREVDPAHARLCVHTHTAMEGSASNVTKILNPGRNDGANDDAGAEHEDSCEEETDTEDEADNPDDGSDTSSPSASPLRIPHVRYAYDVSKSALTNPHADVLAGLPRNRTVVIYVHGFRADDPDTHSFRTLGCLLHLELRLREGRAALQHRNAPDTCTGTSEMRESAAAAVADAVGAAAARQRHEDWEGWAAAQHPVIAGGLLTEQGRRVRLSSHESEDIVLSAPNSPDPRRVNDGDENDDANEPAPTPRTQRRAIMQRRAERLCDGSTGDSTGQEGDAPIIMGFVWPCHNKTTAYHKARAKAERAGKVLRPLLETLAARGNTTLLVAHSMGTRVALTALREESTKPPDIVFDNPINLPEPEPEPEPEPALDSAVKPQPLPRPKQREVLAPAIVPVQAMADPSATSTKDTTEGTVLWREGEGIIPASNAAAGDGDDHRRLKLAPEACTDSRDNSSGANGSNIKIEGAVGGSPRAQDLTEADNSWMYDGAEQTPPPPPPPTTPGLGSRIVNDGGDHSSDSVCAGPQPRRQLVSHAFLLAGAVSADALHIGRGEFSLDRLRADNVTVAYSSNDSVLRDTFWVAESMPALRAGGGSAIKINPRRPSSFRDGAAGALAHARDARDATKTAATAIGFQGPTEATLQAASVCAQSDSSTTVAQRECAVLRTVDVTGSVRSHRVNQWLGSAEISLRIAAAVQVAAAERSESQGGDDSSSFRGKGDSAARGTRRDVELEPTDEELQKARISATSSVCTPTKAADELDESEEPVTPDYTEEDTTDTSARIQAGDAQDTRGVDREMSTE